MTSGNIRASIDGYRAASFARTLRTFSSITGVPLGSCFLHCRDFEAKRTPLVAFKYLHYRRKLVLPIHRHRFCSTSLRTAHGEPGANWFPCLVALRAPVASSTGREHSRNSSSRKPGMVVGLSFHTWRHRCCAETQFQLQNMYFSIPQNEHKLSFIILSFYTGLDCEGPLHFTLQA